MHKIKFFFFLKRMLMELPDFFLKFIPAYVLTLFAKRPKQLWLISERPDEAGDNGYVLFKWLRENHPELKVFYAIKSNSADFSKVECLGNVVDWASWEHFKIYCTASILCCAHGNLCSPVYFSAKAVRKVMPIKGKRVFIDHGIKKDKHAFFSKKHSGFDLLVCGMYQEWLYFMENFGYTNSEPKYLGLARWDCLENTNLKKQIVYMPTWRIYMRSVTDEVFEKSKYYQTISWFLMSEELQNFLNNYDVEFIFYLHPAFKEKISMFEKFRTDKIKVLNSYDVDLSVLKNSCSLMITDYSSIVFDIAYLNKPVVYFQFDEDEFRQKHYSEGYFNYLRDGFGPIFNNYQDVISYIKKLDDAGYRNPEIYSQRIADSFKLRDKNNCLRHYRALCELDDITFSE